MANAPTEGGWHSLKPVIRQNDELDDKPTTFSAREAADAKKMIERVLQQNKLLPVPKKQSRGRLPFVADVIEKPLPRTFKMPQITPYLGKDDHYGHV